MSRPKTILLVLTLLLVVAGGVRWGMKSAEKNSPLKNEPRTVTENTGEKSRASGKETNRGEAFLRQLNPTEANLAKLCLPELSEKECVDGVREYLALFDKWKVATNMSNYRAVEVVKARIRESSKALFGYWSASPHGAPIYRDVLDDLNSVVSISADDFTIGAPTGKNVRVAIFDGGLVRVTHEKFSSGAINTKRSIANTGTLFPSGFSDHATIVASMIGASGAVGNIRCFGSSQECNLAVYWNEDQVLEKLFSEVALGVPVSNHSYSFPTGFRRIEDNKLVWFGGASRRESVEFGHYSIRSYEWDDFLKKMNMVLPIFAGGNSMAEIWRPAPGQDFYFAEDESNAITYDPAIHPLPNQDYRGGYATIGERGIAKNVLTVGSTTDAVTNGLRDVSVARRSEFSSTGPADDGRIKPDVMANGDGVIAATSATIDSYSDEATTSGTSFAAPVVTGAAALMIEAWRKGYDASTASVKPSRDLLSSTLKALIIHTSDDLETLGPDYKTGWGLVNAKAGVDWIQDHWGSLDMHRITESSLADHGDSKEYSIYWDGTTPLKVTLAWIDPAGKDDSATNDDRTPDLVHNLNLEVEGPDGKIWHPFVMPYQQSLDNGEANPTNFAAAAVRGVNKRDNVEQVWFTGQSTPTPPAGWYTARVSVDDLCEGSGDQSFSLVISGQSGRVFEGHELPQIISEPENVQALEGTTAQFTLEAFSPADSPASNQPLYYRWFKVGNPVPIREAIHWPELPLPNLNPAQAGIYFCLVSYWYRPGWPPIRTRDVQLAVLSAEQSLWAIRENTTLTQDQVHEGNLRVVNGTLNLNGHSLHVKGNVIVSGSGLTTSGVISVQNGSLIVDGDLTVGEANTPIRWANGHYYEAIPRAVTIDWQQMAGLAAARGGYLATLTSQPENDFVYNLIRSPVHWWTAATTPTGPFRGPAFGAFQLPGTATSANTTNWRWSTSEAWSYSNWNPASFANSNGNQDWAAFGRENSRPNKWDDVSADTDTTNGTEMWSSVVEYEPPGQGSIPQPNSLVAHYSFENNSLDSSTQDNHATLLNGATFVDGIRGKGVRFDGIDDLVRVPYSASLPGFNWFTVSAWVNVEMTDTASRSDYEAIIEFGDGRLAPGTAKCPFLIALRGTDDSSGTPLRRRIMGASDRGGGSLALVRGAADSFLIGDQWNMVTLRFDIGNRMHRTLFINGVAVGLMNGPPNGEILYGLSSLSVQMGRFKGRMDEVRIYNSPLSDVEIRQLYWHDVASEAFPPKRSYPAAGRIEMANPASQIVVKGDFVMASKASNPSVLTNGTLIVQGDFKQMIGNAGNLTNFAASANHRTILAGRGLQRISFETPGASHFGTLECVPYPEKTVSFETRAPVAGLFKHRGVDLLGTQLATDFQDSDGDGVKDYADQWPENGGLRDYRDTYQLSLPAYLQLYGVTCSADVAKNGQSYLINHGFGVDPVNTGVAAAGLRNLPSASVVTNESTGEKTLCVCFTRPTVATAAIEYVVQGSNSLVGGWQEIHSLPQVTPNGNGLELVTVQDTAPISSAPKRFVRVMIREK